MLKFGLSLLVIVFDVLFILQHYLFYRDRSDNTYGQVRQRAHREREGGRGEKAKGRQEGRKERREGRRKASGGMGRGAIGQCADLSREKRKGGSEKGRRVGAWASVRPDMDQPSVLFPAKGRRVGAWMGRRAIGLEPTQCAVFPAKGREGVKKEDE